MRLTQTLKQKPTVSPQLVLANELLQFSSLELEQAVAHELAENPALELREIQRCPSCGAEMMDGVCPTCRAAEVRVEERSRERLDAFAGNGADGEWGDLISRLPSRTTLAEHLLRQARLTLRPERMAIARHLVRNLDDRGWLSCDVADLASNLGAELEHVEEVLDVVQSLEPVGIAARDARECLLIQIADLHQRGVERPVAERLIRHAWDGLGRSSPASLGRAVDATVDEVQDALRFIREHLHPFPAHAFWAEVREGACPGTTTCPEPDIIICQSASAGQDYEIEIPQADRYRLRVNTSYCCPMDDLRDGNRSSRPETWKRWEELCGRARLFVRSVEQRWQTLYDLMHCLVDYQHDFLVNGVQSLRPLTRAQLAEFMGVHESTVSRAVAGKYVELPCGEVVPLAAFFDSAAPVKRIIEQLVDGESHEETCLSDRAIAEQLAERGYHVARRTVAKYRNDLNILPSSLRRWSKQL